jgi:hypothetical protein
MIISLLSQSSAFAHWALSRVHYVLLALNVSLRLDANEAQWFQLRPELEAQDWGDSPPLFTCCRCMNHRLSIYHLAFHKPVKLHWWTCEIKWSDMTGTYPWSFDPWPHLLTARPGDHRPQHLMIWSIYIILFCGPGPWGVHSYKHTRSSCFRTYPHGDFVMPRAGQDHDWQTFPVKPRERSYSYWHSEGHSGFQIHVRSAFWIAPLMSLAPRARDFHGNHEGSITTYDHVNGNGSQSVRGIQSLTPRNKFGSGAESEPRRKPTDDVGRMSEGLAARERAFFVRENNVVQPWV